MSRMPTKYEAKFVTLDDVRVCKAKCPGCGTWQYLDEDQYYGRVSVDCSTEGCSLHETVDFSNVVCKKEG